MLAPPHRFLLSSRRKGGSSLQEDDCSVERHRDRPGGKKERGETAREACIREIEEETGYRLRSLRLRVSPTFSPERPRPRAIISPPGILKGNSGKAARACLSGILRGRVCPSRGSTPSTPFLPRKFSMKPPRFSRRRFYRTNRGSAHPPSRMPESVRGQFTLPVR